MSPKKDRENQKNPPQKFSDILKIIKSELMTKPYIFIAIIGIVAGKVTVIGMNHFGPLLVNQLIEDKTEAKNHLSILFLLGNLLSMCLKFSVGFLSDKYPIHVLFSITNVLIMLFFVTFYQSY